MLYSRHFFRKFGSGSFYFYLSVKSVGLRSDPNPHFPNTDPELCLYGDLRGYKRGFILGCTPHRSGSAFSSAVGSGWQE